MTNRIRTLLRQFREQADLHRARRNASLAPRAQVGRTAGHYPGQRPAIGVGSLSQYPLTQPIR